MKHDNISMPPVTFVFGAMRSGTTVFRLMLNAHSKIDNPGEFDFLFDYISPIESDSTDWNFDKEALTKDRNFLRRNLVLDDDKDGLELLKYLLDQIATVPGASLMLNVHRNIDRIIKIFPDTKIIHLLRDPRDVALLSIGMGWAKTIYFGVDHWLASESDWDAAVRALPTEQIFTLKYEDLFIDIELQLVRICQFIGVDFENGMLRYYEKTSYGPPNTKSIERWRGKVSDYDVAILEGKAADMMILRGYVLNGIPIQSRPGKKLQMWLHNKLGVWLFGGRRFGHGLYLGGKDHPLAGNARVKQISTASDA